MSVTPSRPVPAATTAGQQRLEVELLLGEAVLSTAELAAAGLERWRWSPVFPQQRCRELGCLPVANGPGGLVMAVPSHWSAEQRQLLLDQGRQAGLQLQLRLSMPEELRTALEQEPLPASPRPLASLTDDLELDSALETVAEEAPDGLDLDADQASATASPVVSLVDRVLVQALSRGASDIHIEPQDDGLLVRFRQDGVLEAIDKLPKQLTPAVTSRLKIMADLDIAERRLPQDGRIRRRWRGRQFDLRVSTLPTRYGEKVCMRLLDSGSTHLGLDRLITDPAALASVREMGSKPFGMLLVTGPTGSGKSTTLYALLAERNEPGINISTVEDPIE